MKPTKKTYQKFMQLCSKMKRGDNPVLIGPGFVVIGEEFWNYLSKFIPENDAKGITKEGVDAINREIKTGRNDLE